jgi:hypothetical protein
MKRPIADFARGASTPRALLLSQPTAEANPLLSGNNPLFRLLGDFGPSC